MRTAATETGSERSSVSAGPYAEAWSSSVQDPDGFWLEAARAIEWTRAPERGLDDGRAPFYRWFPDGELNVCVNAVDRHVAAGRGGQDAIRFDSAMTGEQRTISYEELQEQVARFAGVLRRNGARRGDRVVIYLPMIPEAVVAMLACARIGAVHSVIFGGFAAPELTARIDDAKPTLIVTASGGLEPTGPVAYLPIVRSALRSLGGPEGESSVRAVIVKGRPQVEGAAADQSPVAGERWLDWDAELADAPAAAPVPVASTDPLYVLYTSGTTGNPKGVVRDSGGYAVALAWSMRAIFGVGAGDVMWTASDVGWVVGHSYIVYAPLLVGATTVLYEGKPIGTPDAAQFWRLVERHRVKVLFTAPTAVRAVRRTDPELAQLAGFDLRTLEAVYLAGERLDTETYHWLADALRLPVIDNWWQTETGWPITANPRGLEPLPVKPGSSTVPVPGFRVEVVDGRGRPRKTGAEGNVVIRLPLPPGSLTSLWNGEERYRSAYLSAFPGHYATGDSGYIDEDGYVFIVGRTDDVINVAGHRLSTGQLEEAVLAHPTVAECAVIGADDALKGQRPIGFVTLKAGETIPEEELRREIIGLVRTSIGPVASFKDVHILARLPKTRSGKILRKTIRQIVNGETYKVPATVEDETVLADLEAVLARSV